MSPIVSIATEQPQGIDPLQVAVALIVIISALVTALVWMVKFQAKQSDKHVDTMAGAFTSTMTELRADVRAGLAAVEEKLEEKLERTNDSLTSLRDEMSIVRANTGHMAYGDVTPPARPGLRDQPIPASGRHRRGP